MKLLMITLLVMGSYKMKKILSLSIFGLILLILSCAQSTAPDMPQLTTREGKICLKECQNNYSFCNGSCRGNAFQINKCSSNCNVVLEDCYTLCN